MAYLTIIGNKEKKGYACEILVADHGKISIQSLSYNGNSQKIAT